MTLVWFILAFALISGVVGMVIIYRRRAAQSGEAGGTEPSSAPRKRETPRPRSQVAPKAEVAGSGAGGQPTPSPAEEAIPAPPPKPQPTEAELRSQVQAMLEESDRLLGELRQLAGGLEGAQTSLDAGSVDLLGEALGEVRALADRKEWGQARDKGQALRAQLTMMLQMARRGQTS